MFRRSEDKRGCDEKNLTKIKETALRERETNLKENQFWLSLMSSSAQNGEEVTEILGYNDWVNKLSVADMNEFAAEVPGSWTTMPGLSF